MSRRGARALHRRGFTLVELGLVIVVISLLLVAVLQGQSLVGTAGSQAALAAVKDLATAIAEFRSRYGYLPGDMPTATANVPGVVAGSCSVTANGNGDGTIDAAEAPCVPEHLFRAGLIKGGYANTTLVVAGVQTAYANAIVLTIAGNTVAMRALARASSGVTTFSTSTRNVIELINLPCRQAIDLDTKSDDGVFSTGNTRASVASCIPTGTTGATNDPVPSIAVAL